MLGHEVDFSTACKDPNYVCVRELLSSVTHVLFGTKAFEKAFLLIYLVHKHYLSTIDNHPVCGVAMNS